MGDLLQHHLHSSSLTAIYQGKKPGLGYHPSSQPHKTSHPFPQSIHSLISFHSFLTKHKTQNHRQKKQTKTQKRKFKTMDHFFSSHTLLFFALTLFLRGGSGATFTFTNNCDYTVWPGILSNAGSQALETTGFELSKGGSRSFQAPTGWSGRFWGRTGCTFDSSGSGTCATGDCGSGQVECNGAGAAPPATLAEFTLGGSGGKDFYDVSLVDGYNLPMVVAGSGGSGMCGTTGCVADLNQRCPAELRVGEGEGEGCRSACEAFGRAEYCCSGEYGTPDRCRPSVYSAMFKSACPSSYSYAYDDATSTFTCTGADYQITFCPSLPSQKSSKESPTRATAASTSTTTQTGEAGVMLADDSWLASLATADASRAAFPHEIGFIATIILLMACLLL